MAQLYRQIGSPQHPRRDAHRVSFGGYGDVQVLGLACDVLDCHGNLQLDDVLDVGGFNTSVAI